MDHHDESYHHVVARVPANYRNAIRRGGELRPVRSYLTCQNKPYSYFRVSRVVDLRERRATGKAF